MSVFVLRQSVHKICKLRPVAAVAISFVTVIVVDVAVAAAAVAASVTAVTTNVRVYMGSCLRV